MFIKTKGAQRTFSKQGSRAPAGVPIPDAGRIDGRPRNQKALCAPGLWEQNWACAQFSKTYRYQPFWRAGYGLAIPATSRL